MPSTASDFLAPQTFLLQHPMPRKDGRRDSEMTFSDGLATPPDSPGPDNQPSPPEVDMADVQMDTDVSGQYHAGRMLRSFDAFFENLNLKALIAVKKAVRNWKVRGHVPLVRARAKAGDRLHFG